MGRDMEISTKKFNGFEVDDIMAIVGAIQSNPDIANFELRAQNTWISGGHNRSTSQEFYGAVPKKINRFRKIRLTLPSRHPLQQR